MGPIIETFDRPLIERLFKHLQAFFESWNVVRGLDIGDGTVEGHEVHPRFWILEVSVWRIGK